MCSPCHVHISEQPPTVIQCSVHPWARCSAPPVTSGSLLARLGASVSLARLVFGAGSGSTACLCHLARAVKLLLDRIEPMKNGKEKQRQKGQVDCFSVTARAPHPSRGHKLEHAQYGMHSHNVPAHLYKEVVVRCVTAHATEGSSGQVLTSPPLQLKILSVQQGAVLRTHIARATSRTTCLTVRTIALHVYTPVAATQQIIMSRCVYMWAERAYSNMHVHTKDGILHC